MIHKPMIQGSTEWLNARVGLVTASEMDRILTPKTWKPTSADTRHNYMMRLLAELILDDPVASESAPALEHGLKTEPKARAAYEMLHGVDVELAGFCTTDDGKIGCSPDGFVGDTGLVEIKSPFKPEIHVGYLSDPATLKQEYWVQVQGQMYVTGRKWTDLVSYFSGIEMVCIRVEPHPEFQEKLAAELKSFVGDLALMVDRAIAKGWIKPKQEPKDIITEEDLDAILEARK